MYVYIFLQGMIYVLPSATFPDLVTRFDATVEEMSRTLFSSSIGSIFGVLLGGVSDKFLTKRDLILGLIVIIGGIITMLMPIFPVLPLLTFLFFLQGFIWNGIYLSKQRSPQFTNMV